MKRIAIVIILASILSLACLAQTPGKAGDKSKGPWGDQVSGTNSIHDAMKAMGINLDAPFPFTKPDFSESLTIGPDLWKELVAYAPEIKKYGTTETFKSYDGGKSIEVRELTRREIKKVFKHKECLLFIENFRMATYKFATTDKRKRCYELGAHGIKGYPVTVSTQGNSSLLIMLDKKKRICLLELLSNDFQINPIVADIVITSRDMNAKYYTIKYEVKNLSTSDYYLLSPANLQVVVNKESCALTFKSPLNPGNMPGKQPVLALIPPHSTKTYEARFKPFLPESCKKQNIKLEMSFISATDMSSAEKLNGDQLWEFLKKRVRNADPVSTEGDTIYNYDVPGLPPGILKPDH